MKDQRLIDGRETRERARREGINTKRSSRGKDVRAIGIREREERRKEGGNERLMEGEDGGGKETRGKGRNKGGRVVKFKCMYVILDAGN